MRLNLGISIILIIVLSLGFILPVSAAETISLNETDEFYFEAPDGYAIYQVSINDLEEGYSSLYFNQYGEVWTININCTRSWGWWNFEVEFVYPNATTYEATVSTLQPFASDYDVKVQYIDAELDWIFDVDLYVDFNPVAAGLSIPAGLRDHIEFYSVYGSLSDDADITIWIGTADDIIDVENNDPWASFCRSMSLLGISFFSWTWDTLLAFLNAIPYVGDYFVPALEITAALLGELWFYFSLFVLEEPEISLLTIETIIMAHAIISGRSLISMLKILYKDHLKLIHGVIWVISFIGDIVKWVVNIVTAIVDALKPV